MGGRKASAPPRDSAPPAAASGDLLRAVRGRGRGVLRPRGSWSVSARGALGHQLGAHQRLQGLERGRRGCHPRAREAPRRALHGAVLPSARARSQVGDGPGGARHLLEPNGVQRPVPGEQQGRVQRADRPLCPPAHRGREAAPRRGRSPLRGRDRARGFRACLRPGAAWGRRLFRPAVSPRVAHGELRRIPIHAVRFLGARAPRARVHAARFAWCRVRALELRYARGSRAVRGASRGDGLGEARHQLGREPSRRRR